MHMHQEEYIYILTALNHTIIILRIIMQSVNNTCTNSTLVFLQKKRPPTVI